VDTRQFFSGVSHYSVQRLLTKSCVPVAGCCTISQPAGLL